MVKFTNFYFLLPGNQENDFFFLKVITLKEKSCIPSSYYYGKLFPLIIDLVSKLDITDKMMSKIPQKEVTNFSLQYFFFSFFFMGGGGGGDGDGDRGCIYLLHVNVTYSASLLGLWMVTFLPSRHPLLSPSPCGTQLS